MSDERFRSLRRLAEATGDSVTWQALVWDHLRTGQPFDVPTAMVATVMANQLSRGGAGLVGKGKKQRKHTNLPEQVELDAALLASGFLQLHHTTARLRRALIRHFGSARAALAWTHEVSAESPSPDEPIRLNERRWLEAVLARVQLPVAPPSPLDEVYRELGSRGLGRPSWVETVAPEDWRLVLDELRVGTPWYDGQAIFWHRDYDPQLNRQYALRVSDNARRQVHAAFLVAGLPVNGRSRAHLEHVAAAVRADSHEHAIFHAIMSRRTPLPRGPGPHRPAIHDEDR